MADEIALLTEEEQGLVVAALEEIGASHQIRGTGAERWVTVEGIGSPDEVTTQHQVQDALRELGFGLEWSMARMVYQQNRDGSPSVVRLS